MTMTIKQRYAIIVAGGSGKRMGNELPKQFIEIAGKPILMHTMERFVEAGTDIQIVLILPDNQHSYWKKLIEKFNFNIKHKFAAGGVERFNSVLNGLQYVPANAIVAVHDGVRPLVSVNTINKCYTSAVEKGAVIPVVPATESIRKAEGLGNIAVNRSEYFMVQTPQVFQSNILLKAYKQKYNSSFTDDASVVEKAGYSICLVDGNEENIKITRPMDLRIAEVLLTTDS